MIQGTTVVVEIGVIVGGAPMVRLDGESASESEWVEPFSGRMRLTFTEVSPGEHALVVTDRYNVELRIFRTIAPTPTLNSTP